MNNELPREANLKPQESARIPPGRRDVVALFRRRLAETITRSGKGRSAFAKATGVERSTLSQLLSPDNDRLPRLDTLASIAASCGISIDWLVGLSQRPDLGGDVVEAEPMEIAPTDNTPLDERLARWHAEAVGYKCRYVPATLPDLLKTDEVIEYELRGAGVQRSAREIGNAHVNLAYQRRPDTDMEVCSSTQSLEAFARGEGVWRGLPAGARKTQLRHMLQLVDELYPTFRWFLFDGTARHSVPLTVFGPQRAVIFVGQMYLVFNATEQIRALTRHFDELIRAAVVQPHETYWRLQAMLNELDHAAPRAG